MRQSLAPKFDRTKYTFKFFLAFFMICLGLITSMYNSVVIAIMAAPRKAPNIDSLYDLATKYEYTDKRLYVDVYELGFERSEYYEALKDRTDYFKPDEGDIEENALNIFQDVLEHKTHVLLEYENLVNHDFKLLPDWFKCKHPYTGLF